MQAGGGQRGARRGKREVAGREALGAHLHLWGGVGGLEEQRAVRRGQRHLDLLDLGRVQRVLYRKQTERKASQDGPREVPFGVLTRGQV